MTGKETVLDNIALKVVPAGSSPLPVLLGKESDGEVKSRTLAQVRSDIGARSDQYENIMIIDISRSETTRIDVANGVYRMIAPIPMNIRNVIADLTDAPSGSDVRIDAVDSGGSSRLIDIITIPDGFKNNVVSPGRFSSPNLAAGDVVSFNILDVGSVIKGAGLKIYITYS